MTVEEKTKLRKVRRAEKKTKKLQRMRLGYLLGGARGNPDGITGPRGKGDDWTDCSGFALYLCRVMGINNENKNGWTGTLVNEGKEGTSPYFTLYLKEPEQTEGHVIIRFRHHPRWRRMFGLAARWRWAECGGFDNPNPGGGPTFFKPTESRVNEFPFKRHFPEL